MINEKYNESENIIAFLGSYLCNWYPCIIEISEDNSQHSNYYIFDNSEQLFVYYKAIFFKDFETADKILKTQTPKVSMELGREVKNYNEEEWSKVRFDFMYKANYEKFNQNEDLLEKLINTKDKILVEGNSIDYIWGVGIDWKNNLIFDQKNWNGLNLLGKTLMKVREDLRFKQFIIDHKNIIEKTSKRNLKEE
jgi:ribA/ribD-fused uncharacterized protein